MSPSGSDSVDGGGRSKDAAREPCLGVPGGQRPPLQSGGPTVRRAAPGEDAMTATEERSTRTGEKLLGRVAFVTGGTRGIGAAICRSLAKQGAEVAAGYSGNEERAETFAQEFAGAYP